MALSATWIEHLFGRLSVRYGAAFLRQWPDAEPAVVKADWAEVLDGVSGDSISYALRYLPNTPPNAMQFLSLCRSAPRPDVRALPAPSVKADPDRVKQLVGRLKEARDSSSPAEACARYILALAKANDGKLTRPQREQLIAMGFIDGAVA